MENDIGRKITHLRKVIAWTENRIEKYRPGDFWIEKELRELLRADKNELEILLDSANKKGEKI